MNPKLSFGLAVGVSLLSICAVYMKFNSLQDQKAGLETLRKQAKSATAKKVELDESQSKVKAAQEKLAHLEQGVPQFAYVSTLLTELEDVGSQCGLAVLGIKPQIAKVAPKKDSTTKSKSTKKSYEELNLELKGRGTYTAMTKFLNALQSFPKIAAVRTVTMTPKTDPNRTGSPELEVTVELRAYVFPEKQDALKSDAPRS